MELSDACLMCHLLAGAGGLSQGAPPNSSGHPKKSSGGKPKTSSGALKSPSSSKIKASSSGKSKSSSSVGVDHSKDPSSFGQVEDPSSSDKLKGSGSSKLKSSSGSKLNSSGSSSKLKSSSGSSKLKSVSGSSKLKSSKLRSSGGSKVRGSSAVATDIIAAPSDLDKLLAENMAGVDEQQTPEEKCRRQRAEEAERAWMKHDQEQQAAAAAGVELLCFAHVHASSMKLDEDDTQLHHCAEGYCYTCVASNDLW